MNRIKFTWARGCVLALTLSCAHAVFADTAALPGTQTLTSKHSFSTLVSRVEAAVAQQKMGLVATASASMGAAGRGIKIPGNTVLMVFRNDYAVRMLQASVPAGIEAPIRLYVTENPEWHRQPDLPHTQCRFCTLPIRQTSGPGDRAGSDLRTNHARCDGRLNPPWSFPR